MTRISPLESPVLPERDVDEDPGTVGAPSPRRTGFSSWFRRTRSWLVRWFLGDDIFFSYARADGGTYAAALAGELAERKYHCKLDQWGSPPGKEIPPKLKRALRRSLMLVVVGTRGAAESESVAEEIRDFLAQGGEAIIPIDLDGSLKAAPWWPLLEGLYESVEDRGPGDGSTTVSEPSSRVVKRIEKCFVFTRRDLRLKRTAAGITVLILILAGISAAAAWLADSRLEAAQEAIRARDSAQAQKQLAEIGRERAVSTERGAQAVVTSREPGRRLEALLLGIRAAGEELLAGRDLEAQAYAGLASAVDAGERRIPLEGHSDHVFHVGISADGNTAVTASLDHSARLWSVAEPGRPIATLPHADAVVWAEFDPGGQRLVTASRDGSAVVWSAADGSRLFELTGHSGAVLSARFSPTGERILTAGDDGTARLWNVSDGTPAATLTGHRGKVRVAVFSADGRHVATGGEDAAVRLWRTADGELSRTLRRHSESISCLAFSSDGRRLLSGSADHQARLWTVPEGRFVTTLTGHEAEIGDCAFSPDGDAVVTTDADGKLVLWDAESGRPLGAHSVSGWVSQVEFSPDGTALLAVATDTPTLASLYQTSLELRSELLLFDLSKEAEPERLTMSEGRGVFDARFAGDGRRIVFGGEGGLAGVRSLRDPKLRYRLAVHTGTVFRARFSPAGDLLATAGRDGVARLWSSSDGTAVATLRGHGSEIVAAAFSDDGRQLATASSDQTARLWIVPEGESIVLRGHGGPLTDVAFLPGGGTVVTTGTDRTARLWKAEDGSQIAILEGHEDSVFRVAVSPDGQRIATAGFDGAAMIWDATGQRLATLRAEPAKTGLVAAERLDHVAFSHAGSRVVTSGFDTATRVWHVDSGRLECELLGHRQPVWYGEFSPDDELVASAGLDGTVRVWNTRDCSLAVVLRGHLDEVRRATFFDAGRRLLTASLDGTARIWAIPEGSLLATLRGHPGGALWAEVSAGEELAVTSGADGGVLVFDVRAEALLRKALKYAEASPEALAELGPRYRPLAAGGEDAVPTASQKGETR